MPLPASPMLLLAAAGLALIGGRYLRASWFWGLYFLSAMLGAALAMAADQGLPSSQIDILDLRLAWSRDALTLAEQWLVWMFGLLTGIAMFDGAKQRGQVAAACGGQLFLVSGLMLVASANDFLSLGLSIEIVFLATKLLRDFCVGPGGMSGTDLPMRTFDFDAGRNSTWFHGLASSWMWIGIALLSNCTATTQFDSIRLVLTEVSAFDGVQGEFTAPSKWILVSVGMILVGLLARIGMVPLHLGLTTDRSPHAAESTGVAILAGYLTGSIALTRLVGCVFVGLGQSLIVLLMVATLTTFGLASLMAARGFSPGVKSVSVWIKSLILFRSGWMGVQLMILTNEIDHPLVRWGSFPNQRETIALVVFDQWIGMLSMVGLCWTLSHLSHRDRDIEFGEDLKGLGQLSPLAAAAILVSGASAIGCPLTGGFWGRWLTLLAGHNGCTA